MAKINRSELDEAELDIPAFLRHRRAVREPEIGPCRCGERPAEPPWVWGLSRDIHTALRAEGFNCAEPTVWRMREGYLERFYLLGSRWTWPEPRCFQLSVGVEFPELQLPERRWDPSHVWPWIRPVAHIIPTLPDRWEWPLAEEERFRSELIAAILAVSGELPSRVGEIRSRFLARFPR